MIQPHWTDDFFGVVFRRLGIDLPQRPLVELVGGGVSAVDVPAEFLTRITISGGVGSRATATADLDGNVTPTATLYTVPFTANGIFQITATVLATKLVAGVLTPTNGGAMRAVGSWKRAAGTATLLRNNSAAGQTGGAFYLLDTLSAEADMDLAIVVSGSNVIVQVTPTVNGTYRYDLDVEIRGPVT